MRGIEALFPTGDPLVVTREEDFGQLAAHDLLGCRGDLLLEAAHDPLEPGIPNVQLAFTSETSPSRDQAAQGRQRRDPARAQRGHVYASALGLHSVERESRSFPRQLLDGGVEDLSVPLIGRTTGCQHRVRQLGLTAKLGQEREVAVRLRGRRELDQQQKSQEDAEVARRAASALGGTARWTEQGAVLDVDLLLGDVLADHAMKYVEFKGPDFTTAIERSLLARTALVQRLFIDVAAYVDADGLRLGQRCVQLYPESGACRRAREGPST